jgi:hypothetical protein
MASVMFAMVDWILRLKNWIAGIAAIRINKITIMYSIKTTPDSSAMKAAIWDFKEVNSMTILLIY